MAYRIIKCQWESGEHYRMLVDAESGMPIYWPTLYVTTQIRNRGHTVATMDVALGAIQVLFAFTEARNLDLKERFRSRHVPEDARGRGPLHLCAAQEAGQTRRRQGRTRIGTRVRIACTCPA